MKVLVLQLCRMGDIVQTLPMLAALGDEGHEVDLVVRDEFASLPLPPGLVRRVHAFSAAPADEPLEATTSRVRALSEWLEPLRRRRFDLVINLSHDEASRWIALYVDAGDVRGVRVLRDRSVVATDPWTRYLLTIPSNRRVGAFNLADVYVEMAGGRPRGGSPRLVLDRAAVDDARAILRRHGVAGAPVVGLVPGASDARKRWPAESFSEVGAALRSEGFHVVVLGAPSERPLAEQVVRASGPELSNLAGRTSLRQLPAVLSALDLVVTNDTGTMHLAAAVGTRTLTVTVGPAAVHESAPYGTGHVSLQPELHCHPCVFASTCFDPVCHSRVGAASVARTALALLRGEPLPALDERDVRVYRTEVDAFGLAEARPVHGYPANADDLMQRIYRRFWRGVLSSRARARVAHTGVSGDVEAHVWEPPDGARSRRAEGSSRQRLRALDAPLTRIAELADAGAGVVLQALSGSDAAGPAVAETVERLAAELDLAAGLEPRLAPLCSFIAMDLQLAGSGGGGRAAMDLLNALTSAANRLRLLVSTIAALDADGGGTPVDEALACDGRPG